MTDTKPTLEEQIEWAEVLIKCDSGIAPAVLDSLKKLAAIKDAGDDVVEPSTVGFIRARAENGNKEDASVAEFIDTLLSAYKRVCVERDAIRNEALELAARECEKKQGPGLGDSDCHWSRVYAAAIRKLKV